MKGIKFVLALVTASRAAPLPAGKSAWSGWKNVKHLFIFGDSYTQTGFDVNGTQPNPSNPLGNPPYPGWTSSNGPNWVDFLTTTYNLTSSLLTYNLAYGGATVDASLVAPFQPTVLSLADQVRKEFLPAYSSASPKATFTSLDSLFAFWIGINDVGNSWWLDNATTIYDQIFHVYDGLLGQVYGAGARNFVFLQVPPVNLAPLTTGNGDYAVENEGKMIGVWNEKLKNMTDSFSAKHDGTKIFIHETHGLFSNALKDPKAYEQTSGLKNTTGYCEAYANGTPTWYTKDPSCDYPVNEYFWLNNLHPTFPVHNATAASIAKLLS